MKPGRFARLLGGFALLAGTPAGAMDFTVTRTDDPAPNGCQPGDCSLREAVITANALSGADRIILPAGLFILTIPGSAFDDASIGDLDLDEDVEIIGAGAASSTILAENSSRLFNVHPGAAAHLHKLRLDGGRDGFGGAILQNGTLTMEDAILSGNQATSDGGAIRSTGEVTLRRVQLLNNTSGGNGGAIEGIDTYVYDSTLSGNHAVDGGAIYGQGIHLTRSLVQNNVATGDGGGLHGVPGCSCTMVEVHATTIAGNSGVNGGGIFSGPLGIVESSTLSGNSATKGGAIYASNATSGSSLDLVNVSASTLYLNTATQGSAIYFLNGTGELGKAPKLGNTLVSGSCFHGGTSAPFDAVLGNVESPGNTCNLTASFSTASVPAANLLLGALADNGGPTPTHLPQATSALVGAGWNITCAQFDQRGYVRADGDCDTGAVERGALDDVIFRDAFE